MIDKLDVRIPAETPYSAEFSSLYADIRNDPHGPFHESLHYLASADLRPYGYEAILHTHLKHGKKGDHKLELLDVGKKPFDALPHEVRRIFDTNASERELIRTDLAADVPGVPVPWFLSRVRARWKRFTNAATGNLEYQQMGSRGIETVYLGKRPNCFRIYNKTAELYAKEYRGMLRGVSDDQEVPTFESCFGFAEDFVLTRVERQIGGGRIPAKISTIGSLRRHAPDFNPFDNLIISKQGRIPTELDIPDVMTRWAVLYGKQLCEQMGRHAFQQYLNLETHGNGPRMWKRHQQWWTPGDEHDVTPKVLYDHYYDSVTRQIAA